MYPFAVVDRVPKLFDMRTCVPLLPLFQLSVFEMSPNVEELSELRRA